MPQLFSSNGLFLFHLAIEKALKAHVAKHTHDIPPRIHNLRKLAALANVEVDEPTLDFLSQMNEFQSVGRYPELNVAPMEPETAKLLSRKSQEIVRWLIKQL